MKKEYDFSKGKRGPIIKPDPNKLRITIRLDADIIAHFKGLVHKAGGGNYQSLINEALRKHLATDGQQLDQQTFRKILREELKRAG